MAKQKTEEREYAEDILRETKAKWSNGWNLLSDRQQHSELAVGLMGRILAQHDSRVQIRFFQETAKELINIAYGE